ncbi:hypothetical protein BDV38DRAFT_295134 [Aspergillus pseudotamarii]|uniref:Rhodopsin domain-containing protein n=1 Tax=Aspergillus pseudotamarii TaxID=132259 RepID=A0A5N6T7M9_ASPPS|nr:uncharacterized protein BDV38DRAFT_295134 [Aspergillus pseudotamarii]KAE8142343.1 hypothetical protein BDV38DRAFT_295134 [Aspergillus pseudotamarii]
MGRFTDTWKPAVNVLTWFLMVTAILGVLARLGTKYWIFRRWTADDYLSIVSMVICAAQSLAVSLATANGYGDHYDTLSQTSIENIMKSQYAATILFILTMCFSKLALVHFIRSVTPAASDRRIASGLEALITLWAITGAISSAFRCKPPQTWNYLSGQCFNIGAWWDYIGVTNILTDAAIIAYAILIVTRIQARWKKKLTLSTVFGLRIFVIIAIIGQLAYANKTIDSTDPISGTWSLTICTQLTQCLSVVTACSPQFKPFLDSLRSTGLRVDGMTRHDTSRVGYNHSSAGIRSQLQSQDHPSAEVHEMTSIGRNKSYRHTTTIITAKRDSDGDSDSSEAHIIREVHTWAVTASPRNSLRECAY